MDIRVKFKNNDYRKEDSKIWEVSLVITYYCTHHLLNWAELTILGITDIFNLRRKEGTRVTCRIWWAMVVCGLSFALACCSGGDGGGAGSGLAPQQAHFLALPFSNETVSKCFVNGMSDDGTMVAGQCADEQGELEPVLWVNGKIKRLGFMTNFSGVSKNAYAYGVSNNGIVIGNEGYLNLSPLAYYYKDGTWNGIVNPVDSLPVSYPSGISSDGEVIVGSNTVIANNPSARGAYYFKPSNGKFYILPSIFSGDYDCTASGITCYNLFNAIDGAGKTAVGYDSIYSEDGSISAQMRPLLYRIDSGKAPVLLPLPASYQMGAVQAISRDSKFMAGGTADSWMPVIAVYWDKNYAVHVIGSLGPDTENRDTLAYDVSDSGVAVGESNLQAFIFDSAGGIQALTDYLTALGLDDQIKGWTLQRASAITPDGRYIAGTGSNSQGQEQGFLIYVPPK